VLSTVLTAPDAPLAHTLKKLMSSLAVSSSQIQVTHGFLLSQLVQKMPITQQELEKLLANNLHPKLAIRKSEVNHFYFGRLLCF
jgi:hypothetical protein